MPFVFQLEPEALVRHFLEHPPESFTAALSAAGMPVFSAPFDLLTTADPAWQKRVRGLPGYASWGRVLRPRTRFVGTTVSEYALFPGDADPEQLAASLVHEHGREHAFLIVKDIPHDSPLLAAPENAWSDALTEALSRRGFVVLAGQALAWVPIDFEDADHYLSRLSRGARRDIRRKLRKRDRIEIETVPAGDPRFRDPVVLASFMRLYDAVYRQSSIQFDHLVPEFFRDVLRDGDSGGLVFVYRVDGRMIGWNLCFRYRDALVDKYVGFDYPQASEHNLYVVSWMHNLEYARQHGLARFVAGWTDPEVKVHLGAQMTFTRHAVRPRNPVVRAALRRMSRHFQSDWEWYRERGNAIGRA